MSLFIFQKKIILLYRAIMRARRYLSINKTFNRPNLAPNITRERCPINRVEAVAALVTTIIISYYLLQ